MTDLDQKNLKQSESGDVKRQVKFCLSCRCNTWHSNGVCAFVPLHRDRQQTLPVMPPSALAEPMSSYDRGFNAGVERVAAMLDKESTYFAAEARKFKVGT